MIDLTLKIDPKQFTVSISTRQEHVRELSKPTAEELGQAIIDYVEESSSAKWPGSKFRLRSRKNTLLYVRAVSGATVLGLGDLDAAKIFSGDVTEILNANPDLEKAPCAG
jgi:hypothetical protein